MDVDVRPEEETIGIDEGQFFEDLVEFTFKHLKNKNHSRIFCKFQIYTGYASMKWKIPYNMTKHTKHLKNKLFQQTIQCRLSRLQGRNLENSNLRSRGVGYVLII